MLPQKMDDDKYIIRTIGIIENYNHDYNKMIEILDAGRVFSSDKWHRLSVHFKCIAKDSIKINGERGLAILRIAKCE